MLSAPDLKYFPMKFLELIEKSSIEPIEIRAGSNPEITGIFYDSRRVEPGGLFFAIPGQNFDGHKFIADAVKRGAVAVIGEKRPPVDIDHAVVKSSRYALSAVSSSFYGEPSKKLKVVGITGTNGKTTTAYMVKSILEAAGLATGLIGTVEYDTVARKFKASRTTPEASDLNAMLSEIVNSGGQAAVMEVSSHGLDEFRVEHIDFDIGIITNLTRDHLDYHVTMENYRRAKAHLLELARSAALNADDASFDYFMEFATGKPMVTFGLEAGDLRATVRKMDINGTEIRISGILTFDVRLKLPGWFNVYNALAATAAALLLGVEAEAIRAGLEGLKSVPGRFEVIEGPYFHVIIDYAHTPDALEKLLASVRQLVTDGCVITVFGAGGDRDPGKRPLMAQAVEKYSDVAIVTSDNPRHEDPMKIIRDVESGFTKLVPKHDPDRAKAIEFALTIAKPGDVVVIAGKGHEDYQVIGDEVIHFSDREIVEEILKTMEG